MLAAKWTTKGEEKVLGSWLECCKDDEDNDGDDV